MSDDVVEAIEGLRDQAAAAASADMVSLFDRWAAAQAKVNAGTYKADELATDLADGVNMWLRMGARNMQMAAQVLAAYNTLPVPGEEPGEQPVEPPVDDGDGGE